jgi:hypothetical protein
MVTRGRRCPFAAHYPIFAPLRLRCRKALRISNARPAPSAGNTRSSLAMLHREAGKCTGRAPTACSPLARAQCCVAPSLCFVASNRDSRCVRHSLVSFAAKARAKALQPTFRTPGTGFALSVAIGSTWIRRECNNMALAAAQVRTTASPEFSHRLGSRDAVFISGIAFAQCHTSAIEAQQAQHIEEPRS